MMEIMVDRNVDGVNALRFLHWLYDSMNNNPNIELIVYVALYNKDIDMMVHSDVQFGYSIHNCVIPDYEAEYFKLILDDNDGRLEELKVIMEKPMEESVLDTIKAYLTTNEDVLSREEIESLKAQISYMEQKINDSCSSSPIQLGDISVVVDEDKLKKYLDEGYILEFVSAEECMEHFNEHDYQDFKSVEEMKKYMGRYQFSYKGHYFHINVDEVFDVYTL